MQLSLLGVSAVVITVLSTVNGSSKAELWSMIDQIQLLFGVSFKYFKIILVLNRNDNYYLMNKYNLIY